MYFPYPDHSKPVLKPVGAYHLAQDATPVTQVGALGQMPAGYAPIRSPYFPQHTPWPYIKGPIYTRPVFREHTTGAFVPRPIVRMPSLRGLGAGDPEVDEDADEPLPWWAEEIKDTPWWYETPTLLQPIQTRPWYMPEEQGPSTPEIIEAREKYVLYGKIAVIGLVGLGALGAALFFEKVLNR